jgi:hypothetical protein
MGFGHSNLPSEKEKTIQAQFLAIYLKQLTKS